MLLVRVAWESDHCLLSTALDIPAPEPCEGSLGSNVSEPLCAGILVIFHLSWIPMRAMIKRY